MKSIALILSAARFGTGRGQHPRHEVLRFDPDYDQFVNKAIGAMRQAPLVANDFSSLKVAMPHARHYGAWLEFGVFSGKTMRIMAAYREAHHPPNSGGIYGFDSFKGLPEDWNNSGAAKTFTAKHAFDRGGVPPFPETGMVKWVPGWFDKSLPPFLAGPEAPQTISLLHMDADLYSSTITVFKALADRIQPGLVIVFDYLFKDHEIKALWELLRDRPDLAFRAIGTSTKKIFNPTPNPWDWTQGMWNACAIQLVPAHHA